MTGETAGTSGEAAASGSQIARGAAWLMAFKLADRSVGLISTLILVRLLVPADFGLVAMATSVVALTQLMGAFGFDSALIQRQDCRREHYDTAWTFGVLFGAAIATVLIVLAVPAASFYKEERLAPVLFTLAFGALVGGFDNIGTVAFRKELDFRSEFRFLMIKRVVSFVVTVGLALAFRTYWALVLGVVSSRVSGVWISYRLHPYRPKLTLSASTDLLHFSKWIFISNLVDFLHSRSTDFVLGRTVGTYGLGIYNVAAEIGTMPSTELIAPLNRAVFPAYARLSGNLPQLCDQFLQIFGAICLIGIPIAVGLFCVADPVVRVVLGSKWLDAIPLLEIFTIHGLVSALRSNMYLVVMALGKPKANTLLSAGLLVVSLPAVVLASIHHGLLGAAYAQIIVGMLALVGIVLMFTRITGLRVSRLGGLVWRPLLGSALMAAVMFSIGSLLQSHAPAAAIGVRLLLLIGVGAVAYPLAIAALWLLSGRPIGAERMAFTVLLRTAGQWRRSIPWSFRRA